MDRHAETAPGIFADVAEARRNADVIGAFFARVLAPRDAEAARRLLAADYRDEDPAPVSSTCWALWAAFPDGAFASHEVVAAGDRVIARSTFTGTQTGPFGAMPASGRAVSAAFFDVYVVADGRIRGHRHMFDQALMVLQLGG